MYNGIGLTTPRGSGTNGYVVRNLSVLRSHQPAQDRASAWDVAPPKHREPDEGILEHERKRNIEVKCLELQVKLEDEGLDEDDIEVQVGALRKKLLANLAALAPKIKPSDTHAMAAAKKIENERMARALGTRSDYTEGDAFNKEKQEENRLKRKLEREERERKAEEEKARMMEQRAKWEAEKRERERLRRREEDRVRRERQEDTTRYRERDMPPPRGMPRGRPFDERYHRGRSRSPSRRGPPRDIRRTSLSLSRSPSPRHSRRSPSPTRRRRSASPCGRRRSVSPEPAKNALDNSDPPRHRSSSESSMSVSSASGSPGRD